MQHHALFCLSLIAPFRLSLLGDGQDDSGPKSASKSVSYISVYIINSCNLLASLVGVSRCPWGISGCACHGLCSLGVHVINAVSDDFRKRNLLKRVGVSPCDMVSI